jgi:hypothetical protein
MSNPTPLQARQSIMVIDGLITNKIGMLVEYLNANCPCDSVTELKKLWGVVSSVSSFISSDQVAREVGEAAYPFFLKFEQLVANKDIPALLAYDFTSEIVPGTSESTRRLITGLINSIRDFYLQSSTTVKDCLWEFVASLTRMAVTRSKYVDHVTHSV